MTEDEFVAAMEAKGATDVEVITRQVDGGTKTSLGVQFFTGSQRRRHAVLAPGRSLEAAFSVLLSGIA